ncbi:MAG: DMT family transporter [Dehalococcoidia bacterium]
MLVLTSATLHALWNFLAKRASGDLTFVWLFCVVSTVVYGPVALAIFLIQQPALGPAALAFMAGSTALHLVYYIALQQGYRVGDLSLVYPLARGTGPALATVLAIAILGERPSALTLAGGATIVVGAFLLTGGPSALRGGDGKAILFGLITGALIGSYTVWDKTIVGVLLVPPVIFNWGNDFGRTVIAAPYAIRNWERTTRSWRQFWREAIGVGILGPLSYILVLTALVASPVSTIAPAREISILIGAFLGTRFLGEKHALRRLSAAGLMVLGIVALTLG